MGRNKRKSKKLSQNLPIDKKPSDDFGKKTQDDDSVDIRSRLNFPIIKNRQIESEDDDEEDEETIEFDFRARKIFLPNSCLVCSQICENPKYLCKICRMVSYCSDQHRIEDVVSHEKLCKLLTRFNKENEDNKSLKNGDDYRILRVNLIKSCENNLRRYLDLWEKEIILYPRACFKCHAICNERKLLQCCPNCKVIFSCENHMGDEDHKKWCLEYRIFRDMITAQRIHGNVDPRIPNVRFNVSPNLASNNFDTIMSKVNNNSAYFKTMDFYNYVTLSHLASIPLTSLYAFQESVNDWKNVENLVIHLIGSEFHYEGINLGVWEKLFLHFLPNLKILKLIITGPELFLPQVPADLLSKVKLCRRCKSMGKLIKVSFVPRKLYHDYSSSLDYEKPNFVCLFNPGLYRLTGFNGNDTWPDTIYGLGQSRVPILVTAYTEREIPMDIARIKSICSNVHVILSPRKNPFASLKPDRNFVSDETVPLIYKNYFLSVVKACDNF